MKCTCHSRLGSATASLGVVERANRVREAMAPTACTPRDNTNEFGVDDVVSSLAAQMVNDAAETAVELNPDLQVRHYRKQPAVRRLLAKSLCSPNLCDHLMRCSHRLSRHQFSILKK